MPPLSYASASGTEEHDIGRRVAEDVIRFVRDASTSTVFPMIAKFT